MRNIPLFALGVLLLSPIIVEAKRININPDNSILSQFNTEGITTFVISSIIDLKGDEILLPRNSTLIFNNQGQLTNGIVVFNNTKIKRKNKGTIFDNCSFGGQLKKGKYYISMFGVKANGKNDDAPIINNVLSVINGCSCELVFDCDGDYGVSSNKNRSTILVGSNTTITFRGKGFLRLLITSKLGAVLSLIDDAHDVVINNVQIDGGGEPVIVGNSGQNGIGAGRFRNFMVNGGIIRNCHKGKDETINGVLKRGDGGKGIQVESADGMFGVFNDIRIEDCHAAISCHRNFQEKGGINVVFSNIFGENCEQFAIIHQTNGEDVTGYEQKVVIKDFIAKNCGFVDGVFIFSRTRYLTIENGQVLGSVKVPAIFRGRISKSVIKNVDISQPCISVIDLNPSPYGNDQRESNFNYYRFFVSSNYDYLISSDENKTVPYRSMTKSLVSAQCKENPNISLYTNEVNSSGMLNIRIELPNNKIFEGQSATFDRKYGAKFEKLKNDESIESTTEGSIRKRPLDLTIKDVGYTFWNSDKSELEVWDGKGWEAPTK